MDAPFSHGSMGDTATPDESIRRGVEQAERGELVSRGSFAQYVRPCSYVSFHAVRPCSYVSFHAVSDQELEDAIGEEVARGLWKYSTTEQAVITVRRAQESGHCPGCGEAYNGGQQ